VTEDGAKGDTQGARGQRRIPRPQPPRPPRKRQDPLTDRDLREDPFNQVRGGVVHAARVARRAESAALAAEDDELVVSTSIAVHPREALGEDAAGQIALELFADEVRQVRPLALGQEGAQVVAHQLVQERALRLAPFAHAAACLRIPLGPPLSIG
jgi:hypothetical protein